MLNALSTAMFALVLRLASETEDAPRGLLALAGHPRLAPAVAALFNEPARAWSLPELARLCNMSRATLARQFQEKLGQIGQRSSDRYPDDARSERTEEIVPLHRRRCGGGRIPIRSGLPARLQEPHGRDPGAVAQNAGAVRPGRLRTACSPADAKPAEIPERILRQA